LLDRQKPRFFRCTPIQAVLAIVPAGLVLAAILCWTFYGFPWNYGPGAGFELSGDVGGYSTVTYVWPQGERAGLKVGDRIPLRSLDLGTRMVISATRDAPFWKSLTFQTERTTQQRSITIHYVPGRLADLGASDLYYLILGTPVMVIVLIIGTLLVLLRPSAATWGWYLWSLFVSGSGLANPWPSPTVGFSFLPATYHLALSEPFVFLAPAGAVGLLIFAIYFPDNQPQGLSRVVAGAAPYLIAPLALVSLTHDFLMYYCFCNPDWMRYVPFVTVVIFAASAVVVALHHVRSRAAERRRLRWMAAALALSFLPYAAGVIYWFPALLDSVAGNILNLDGWLQPLFILPSLAVTYTVLRHRIYDIEFVVSRALVYSLFLIAAISIFAAIDFAFTSLFHGSRAELALDVAVALGLGFWVRAMHNRAIDLVDRVLFRRRYDARMRLKAALAAVASAKTLPAIEEIVTSVAATALGLASAVFFRRVPDGGLLREIGFGWPVGPPWHLLSDDRLVALLDKRQPWIDLKEIGWTRTRLSSPQEPVLAVPMQAGGRVVGVTLYGSRLDGVLSSPDEVRGLADLAQHAASAYLLLDSVRSGLAVGELAVARLSQ
jgi:hypothetical protein